MSNERIVAWSDESCQHVTSGRFYVQYVMENEPGFTPSRETFETAEAAAESAAKYNERRGYDADQVRAIRLSSYAKGRVGR